MGRRHPFPPPHASHRMRHIRTEPRKFTVYSHTRLDAFKRQHDLTPPREYAIDICTRCRAEQATSASARYVSVGLRRPCGKAALGESDSARWAT